MKFRFCGDLDAPDWLLMEISTLSIIVRWQARIPAGCRQTSDRAAPAPTASPGSAPHRAGCVSVSQSVVRFACIAEEVLAQLLGGEIDYAKIAATAEAPMTASDIKASVAAMSFVLSR